MKKLFSTILCVFIIIASASCGMVSTIKTMETTMDSSTVSFVNNTIDIANANFDTNANMVDAQNTTQIIDESDLVSRESDPFDENNIVLSFGALSDIHITGNDDDSDDKLREALEQLKTQAAKHDTNGLDAVAVAGDIADMGKQIQVDIFSQVVKDSGIENIMLTVGNHEYYGDRVATLNCYLATMGETYMKNDIDKSMLSRGARHCKVGDYHFFFIEPIPLYTTNCPYDEDVIKWLDESLETVVTENPNAYVFVFTHPMIYKTCYGSELLRDIGYYTIYLTDILKKYPQVVTFSGHLHYPINDERSIMQTDFTSLGCGSVRYVAVERGYNNINGAEPEGSYEVSTGLLVQLDISGNMRITRMNFSEGDTFKTPWEISSPKDDGSHLKKYSKERMNSNAEPILEGIPMIRADVNVDDGTVSNASIIVNAGKDDDLVHHYKITVKNNITGVTNTYKYLSDFYCNSQPDDMAETYAFDLDITTVGKYTIDIVAVDSWGAESNTISCNAYIGYGDSLRIDEIFDINNENVFWAPKYHYIEEQQEF